jgi:hypothetical protein
VAALSPFAVIPIPSVRRGTAGPSTVLLDGETIKSAGRLQQGLPGERRVS